MPPADGGAAAGGETFLDDTWTLWFHDPGSADWSNGSYQQVATISSANHFWALHSLLSEKIRYGMFFLMREHVFPCWDDPSNQRGGCLSVKVGNDAAADFWKGLCAAALSENLVVPEPGGAHFDAHEHVNGLSVTPKSAFCIFKVWLGELAPREPERYRLPQYPGQAMFRSNAASIAESSARAPRADPAAEPGAPRADPAADPHQPGADPGAQGGRRRGPPPGAPTP